MLRCFGCVTMMMSLVCAYKRLSIKVKRHAWDSFNNLLVSLGESIECYECNSHNDSRCAEKIPPDSLKVNCTEKRDGSKFILCRKTIQIIEFSVNNCKPAHFSIISGCNLIKCIIILVPPDTRTIRSCGFEEGQYRNKCYQRSGFGGRQEVCACDTAYCNEGAATKATFGVLLAALVVLIARA